jgi:small nuclear ribonucleoprotein (snRNP)-like protein
MRVPPLTVLSLFVFASCAELGKQSQTASHPAENTATVTQRERVSPPPAQKPISESHRETPRAKPMKEKTPEKAILTVAQLATVKKAVVQRREGLIYEAVLKGKEGNCNLVLVKVKDPKGGEKDYRVKLCGEKYEITPL